MVMSGENFRHVMPRAWAREMVTSGVKSTVLAASFGGVEVDLERDRERERDRSNEGEYDLDGDDRDSDRDRDPDRLPRLRDLERPSSCCCSPRADS
jgi:hypothetical protein